MAAALKLGNFVKRGEAKLAGAKVAGLAGADLAGTELVGLPKLGVETGLDAATNPKVAGVFANTLPACLALARLLAPPHSYVFACWQFRALARLRQLRSRPRRCQLHSRPRRCQLHSRPRPRKPRRKCKS